MGAFLSERTIVRWTRKVPRLLQVEGSEKDDTIKRSIIKVIVCLKGKYQRYGSADLDLGFCPRKRVLDKVVEREMNGPWHDLVQDHASLFKGTQEDHVWEEKG